MRFKLFTILCTGAALWLPAVLSAQAADAFIKDAEVARTYALKCPGCGHLYTGETAKGAALVTIGIGSLLAGTALALSNGPSIRCSDDLFHCDAKTGMAPLYAGAGVSLLVYAYSFFDAGPSADRVNARNGFPVGRLDVAPTLGPVLGGGYTVGFSIGL
jgi:hypothetical protein